MVVRNQLGVEPYDKAQALFSSHTKMISKLSTYLNRSSRVARDATARGRYSKPDMAEKDP